jgi:hypothetical protein
LFTHWLTLLYLFEGATFIGAWLLGAATTQRAALIAFALTAATHLGTLLVGDLIHRRLGRAKWIGILVAALVLLLAGLGILGIVNGALPEMLRGT